MIDQETVFIIGAGGSIPYGFPSAKELRKLIVTDFLNHFNNQIPIPPYVTRITRATKDRIAAGEKFIKSVRTFMDLFYTSDTSIDLFLTRCPEWYAIGTLAITYYLLKAEQESTFSEMMPPEKQGYNWYSFLFNKMTEKIIDRLKVSEFQNNKVAFITFNYDRSLEHFIHTRLLANFTLIENNSISPNEETDNAFLKLPFYHVYGSLGKISLRPKSKNTEEITVYGFKANSHSIMDISKNIQIMHNNRGNEKLNEIQNKIKSAERIFFLGFSFAPENVDYLDLRNTLADFKGSIYATCVGMYEEEIQKIKSSFATHLSDEKRVFLPVNCVELLRKYL